MNADMKKAATRAAFSFDVGSDYARGGTGTLLSVRYLTMNGMP
jgi:hypothetical protein